MLRIIQFKEKESIKIFFSQDGFVLVGSVAGQRYWSSMLNDKATITCGIWTPDDQQVNYSLIITKITFISHVNYIVNELKKMLDVIVITLISIFFLSLS